MLSEPDAQRFRAQQTRYWNDAAAGWTAWIEWTERNFSPLTAWFADRGCWAPGARVLDVACGAGYPALAAAARVRPGGTVIACDLSPAMIAAASATARARGIDNIEFQAMDAEALAFEDSAIDVATSAYGLMFCPDPQGALREAYRVLKPGGRAAFATWDQPENSPFFSVMIATATGFVPFAAPDPVAPGPFRLSSPRELEAMMRAAGFADVQVEKLAMPFECASIDEYWQISNDVAWKSRLARLTDFERAAFRDGVARAAQPFFVDGMLVLTAMSLCASGRKV